MATVIKELQTRIALKYDSYSAWTTAPGKDLVLLKGEIGICNIDASSQESNVVPTVLFKVGDGTKKFYELPWASAKAADVYGWAKSETVVLDGTTIKFKTGNTVNHTIDLSTFATDAEVKAITDPMLADISSIKASLSGSSDGTIGKTLTDLDARLDVIESTDATKAGSIAKAKADAIAAAASDATTKANTAETNAKAYTDAEVAKDRTRLTAIEGVNTTQGAAISANDAAIKQEVTDRTNAISALDTAYKAADTAINNKIGTLPSDYSTVVAGIAAAKKAGTDAATAVSTLETGKVKTNTDNIAKNAAAISAANTAISTEKSRAEGVEADFETRISAMETFWESTDNSTEVVDTLKEIQNYIASDKSGAATMAGNIQANTNAITALQNIVKDGGTLETRVDAVEAKASANESSVSTLNSVTKGYTGEGAIKTAVDGVSTRAEKGITDAAAAKKAADDAQDDVDTLAGVVNHTTTGLAATKQIADKATADISALTTRVGTAEGNITTIQGIVSTGADANSKLRSAITSLQTLTGDASKGNAKLRTDLDAIVGIVNNTTTGLAATKAIADKNKTDLGTLTSRVAAIESDYLKAEDGYIFNCGTSATVVHVKASN